MITDTKLKLESTDGGIVKNLYIQAMQRDEAFTDEQFASCLDTFSKNLEVLANIAFEEGREFERK